MATKRKKRRSSAKRIKKKASIFIFIIVLGSIIISTLFHYLSHSSSKTQPLLYEEIYAITSDLSNEISKIDDIIYQSLYRLGISEKNILFLTVKPEHDKDYDWDFTELLIQLSDRNSVLQINKIIDTGLSQLTPSVQWKTSEISKNEIDFQVFAMGFFTHKIRLVCEKPQQTFSKNLPKIAIILDDLGYDCEMDISFIQLDLPLSFSVLPLAPHTKFIAMEANKKRCELMLHLPMEPKNFPHLNPGPGALLTCMGETEIRRVIDNHLRQILGIRGVNNHMGSYFTERRDKMGIVLSEIKKRNLFYIDSRTTSRTVAFDMAKKMGVPAASRSVFLDNDLSPKAIRFQMERLLGIARHSGKAIGIGHPHKETLNIIKEYLNRLKTDVEVVPVSRLVN